MAPTIIIVTGDTSLTQDILDLVTGRTAAVLAGVQAKTQDVLKAAEAITTAPPPSPKTT